MLGWVCRWACALYNACSSVEVRWSAIYDGNAREASGQAVLVYGRALKVAFLGSWAMYSLVLRGRVTYRVTYILVVAAFLVFVVRIFLEILDIRDIYSCACTWSAIVNFLGRGG